MASTIAAVTTSGGGVVTTADASGNLNLLAGTTTVVALTTAGAAVTGTLSNTTGATFATSSGSVGIGTTSPSDKLTVISAGTQVGSTNFRNIARIGLATNDASVLLGYDISAGSGIVASTNNYPLAFWTSNAGTYAERMCIDASGNLLVGTTSPSAKVTVIQAANAPAADFYTSGGVVGTPCMYVKKQPNDGSTSQVYIQFLYNNASSGNGQINGNGSGSAAFGSYSDIRLKENVADLPSQLNNIMSLRPVEFDWKDGSGHQIGFIAQEVNEVYPDIVGKNSDGMLTLTDMNKNDARLIKCIQEQQALILALTDRIAALEAK